MLNKGTSVCFSKIIIFFFMFSSAILSLYSPAAAIEIKKVILKGCTVEIIQNKIPNISGDLDNNEIRNMGIKLTDEYHSLGYTTSYVDKLVISEKGVLEIYIIESKILGINITGIEKEDSDLEKAVYSWKGDIYNRFTAEKNAEDLRRRFNLDSVKIYTVNYQDSGDVFLSVKVKKKSRGNFYGSIGVEPIYGITPVLGYYYPFTESAVDLYARLGYRDSEIRRAEGDIKYFVFFKDNSSAVYAGTNCSRFIDRWESRDMDYTTLSVYPVIGFRSIFSFVTFDISVKEIITEIKDYGTEGYRLRDYDTRLSVDLDISNKGEVLSMHDQAALKVNISGGRDNLNGNGYINLSGDFQTSFSPAMWVVFIPSLYSWYTTSDERFFREYVFDTHLLGFYNDFTSTKCRNTAGMYIESEISPGFVYAGPFVNTGYFLNESDKWRSETGGGVKTTIIYGDLNVEIYYAWDLSESPSRGGLSVLINGKF